MAFRFWKRAGTKRWKKMAIMTKMTKHLQSKFLALMTLMSVIAPLSSQAANSTIGSTKGLIDITQKTCPAGAKPLVGKTGYDLVPDSPTAEAIFEERIAAIRCFFGSPGRQ